MREFFKDCLEKLESLTGIRQYFYLQSDPEGTSKTKIVIDGMVEVSKKFNYIPEKYQQQIIRKMMVEDQNYDAINSRVVWKWLELHKNAYSHLTEEELTPDPEPATPEQVAYWVGEFNKAMEQIGKPPIVNGMAELRKSKGYESGVIARDPRPKFIVGEDCPECDGRGSFQIPIKDGKDFDIEPCLTCDLTGKKEPRYEVHASSQAEADKMYKASF